MRQLFLPGFPDGAEKIGSALSILVKDKTVTYFVGSDNYYSHPEGDRKGQRFALTNLRFPDLPLNRSGTFLWNLHQRVDHFVAGLGMAEI